MSDSFIEDQEIASEWEKIEREKQWIASEWEKIEREKQWIADIKTPPSAQEIAKETLLAQQKMKEEKHRLKFRRLKSRDSRMENEQVETIYTHLAEKNNIYLETKRLEIVEDDSVLLCSPAVCQPEDFPYLSTSTDKLVGLIVRFTYEEGTKLAFVLYDPRSYSAEVFNLERYEIKVISSIYCWLFDIRRRWLSKHIPDLKTEDFSAPLKDSH